MGPTRRSVLAGIGGLGLLAAGTGVGAAGGQRGNDKNQGQGDTVTGMYRAVYAYDATGDWYGYNLSNRELESGTVDSVDDLDQETLTVCDYKVQYQGSFGDDPYLDMGWISNHVVCKGYEPDNRNVLFVHETDPRYTGDPDHSIWGTWEYFVDARRGEGNVLVTDQVRPAVD